MISVIINTVSMMPTSVASSPPAGRVGWSFEGAVMQLALYYSVARRCRLSAISSWLEGTRARGPVGSTPRSMNAFV